MNLEDKCCFMAITWLYIEYKLQVTVYGLEYR